MASKGKRTAGKAPATREYKSFKFELESADESGEFSGYAAVFGNKDSGGDIIEKAHSPRPSGRILTASKSCRNTPIANCPSASRWNCVKMIRVFSSGAKSATPPKAAIFRRL